MASPREQVWKELGAQPGTETAREELQAWAAGEHAAHMPPSYLFKPLAE